MPKTISKTILAIIVFVLSSSSAFADRIEDARSLFQEANAHFAVGEFAQAADKFQAAYKLRPDAALLYNAAQSTRLSGNNAKALVLYKNYLQFYPRETNSDEVRGQIERLQAAVAASTSAITAPPQGTAEHPRPPEARSLTTPTPSVITNPAVAVAMQPARKPVYKKWWLWTLIGVAVAGGVVAGAVVASQSSGKWATTADVGPGLHTASVGW